MEAPVDVQAADAKLLAKREVANARTSAAMLRHQRSGRRMSDKCPYGKRRDRLDSKYLADDPDEQRVIDRIISEHRKGRGLRAIGRLLSSEGILCRGGHWNHQTIKAILVRAGLG